MKLSMFSTIIKSFFPKKIKGKIKNRIFVFSFFLKKILHPSYSFFVLTPTHRNMGDHAIAKAAVIFLNKKRIHFYEVTFNELVKLDSLNSLNIFNRRKIFINGGGNLGTLWFDVEILMRKIILNNPDSKIVIFPNSIYYENSPWGNTELEKSKEIYNSHKDLTVIAREKITYEKIKDIYKKTVLIPDLVLSLDEYDPKIERQYCLICFRNDLEKTMSDEEKQDIIKIAEKIYGDCVILTDMSDIGSEILPSTRNAELEKKIMQFRKAKIVFTDRLHGMIFSVITRTPCILFNSRSPKVMGSYEWVKNLGYIKFCENVDVLENLCEQFLQQTYPKEKYNNYEAYKKFMDLL